MSELEKTAPNEIYLIVGDTDTDFNFNELEEVTWADKPIYEETAIKYVKSSQLTIPKSIADELDKVTFHNPIAQLSNKDCDLTDVNDTVKRYAWNNKENGYICVAYLTGKALGVDLVKVGEGINDNY
ncbi:hypothetical protein [Lactococcus cremoris]|uniref:hypothetical protein n=1 Tax=Lactococcus lactis subsp. cremoris TaxID=1359 RepID=UPI002FC6B676